jgi:hypothetical protein
MCFLWMIIEEELNYEDLKIGTQLMLKEDAPDFLTYYKEHVLIITSVVSTFNAATDNQIVTKYTLESPTYPSLGSFDFADKVIQKHFKIVN